MSRLFNTFMSSMDGEKGWQDVVNTFSKSSNTQFFRLNISLGSQYPAIDDTACINVLEEDANKTMVASDKLKQICDAIFASIFFFELDGLPGQTPEGLVCNGSILCRIELSVRGSRQLHQNLWETSAFFLINGQPIKAVEGIPTYSSPFRRTVTFHLQSYADNIGISIRHATMPPYLISSRSRSLNDYVKLQLLIAPFGRRDHSQAEKPLPNTPSKRKSSVEVTRYWSLRPRSKRIRYV